MSLLTRFSWRYFARQGWQLALSIFGVAIGVAVVIAVNLTNQSAERAFELATDSIGGRATHEVVGGNRGLPDGLYGKLRANGFRETAPVVEGLAQLRTGATAQTVRLLGIDVFAEAPLRPWFGFRSGQSDIDLAMLMTRPGAILLTDRSAEALGLKKGSELTIEVSGNRHEGVLAGTLAPRDEWTRRGLESIAVCDVSTAQELLAKLGRLDRIDVRVDDDPAGEQRLARIASQLPAGIEIRPTGARAGALRDLTRGFRINLQAFGFLALLVGAFLIYNTMVFAVVRRREQLAVLRSIGATRRQILGLTLAESIAISTVGIVTGIGLGIGLAQVLLGFVTQTINDHYLTVTVTQVDIRPRLLLTTAGIALVVCVLASLLPALEATRTSPRLAWQRTSLEQRVRGWLPKAATVGALLIVAGGLCLSLSERQLVLSYTGLFTALLGAALLVPAATSLFLRWIAPLLHKLFGSSGSLAARGAETSLSRTAVATSALMLAFATLVGLGGLIHSFRSSVEQWLGSVLIADVYVSVPVPTSARTKTQLAPELVAKTRGLPSVASVATYRWMDVETNVGSSLLAGIDAAPWIRDVYRVIAGNPEDVAQAYGDSDSVLISEPYAWHHDLAPGATVRVRGRAGWRELKVAGVFKDYGSERGWILMSRATFDATFDDPSVTSMALRAAASHDADALARDIRGLAAPLQAVDVRSNRDLLELSLAIFDRTFAITGVLRLLCIAVAFFGMWGALMALQFERVREAGVLRAIGTTRRQLTGLILGQTSLLGLCAGLLAVPVGAALAWVMSHVINRQSFGWTLLETSMPWSLPLEAILVAVLAAVLAGLQPARRLGRRAIASALREE